MYKLAAKTIPRRIALLASANLAASPASPTASAAPPSCPSTSSSLRIARISDPSNISVRSTACWKVPPEAQVATASMSVGLKESQ